MRNRGAVLLVLVIALLSACRAPYPRGEQSPKPVNSELVGTAWRVTRLPSGEVAAKNGEEYTLTFIEPDRLLFQADCNRGEGRWESAEAGAISIGALFMTRAECPTSPVARRYVGELQHVESYRWNGTQLSLELESGEQYEFERTEPGR